MTTITEADVEEIALDQLRELGWDVAFGPEIDRDYSQVVLEERLRDALLRLNPGLPSEALDSALRKLTRPEGSSLILRNRAFHRMLVWGVEVEYRDSDRVRGAQVQVMDFEFPVANDWLAVNQYTVRDGQHTHRPDVALFVNGLPLGVIELKNPTDEQATIKSAWNQLQTYKQHIASLFAFNELMMVSDGTEARIGSLTSGWEWFKPWRTIGGETLADAATPEMNIMLAGVCEQQRLLAFIRDFVIFEDDGSVIRKKLAGYHQFHAVRTAVKETQRATVAMVGEPPGRYESGQRQGGQKGDRRIGVVWHTQGSGKSLTMACYAGAIIREPDMGNPTIVVLTDRNDLDDQLFTTFSRCQDLLRQPPQQAETRADLRQKLSVQAGGVVFTTIQKFMPDVRGDQHPQLSNRRNIVVIADEAHRSQYDFIDGLARHMRDALPRASFIGFTGTPIEKEDANTRAVFGDHISIYDIRRSVEDGATVPIYYESRLAKLTLDPDALPALDSEFEAATEGEEVAQQERLKTKWAQLEAVVGAEQRIKLVAADIVRHFEQRQEVLAGKAMVVCMSRRICVELYAALKALRPEWHDEADELGQIKVVMTGAASDPLDWQQHIRNKPRREALANRFRDADDSLKIVLVRDMWLTGFDAPSLHTMYVDKPMRGHGLMQAIARVNRVFRDKPGGLIVDYLGLAHELKQALAAYTESGGTGQTTVDQEAAVAAMREQYEVCRGLFHGFERSAWRSGDPKQRLALIPAAQEHVLSQEDGKERCLSAVRDLTRAFALAVPHKSAMDVRDEVAFFQAIRAALSKRSAGDSQESEDVDFAVRQIVSRAVSSDEVMDIFAAAGLDKPDISVLSEEFLSEVKGMSHRNLAVELLLKLLKGEISKTRRQNVVKARSFSELLESSLLRYQNRAIEAAQVLEELIELARELREASSRGEALGLTDDELAFYDALETNDSAVQVLGDETLRAIARELVARVRGSATIDWTLREDVRARLRVMVRRTLRRHGYPPDKQEQATRTVLEQAESLSEAWAMGSTL